MRKEVSVIFLLMVPMILGAIITPDEDEYNFYTEETTLWPKMSVQFHGKNITLISFSGNHINVQVDDEIGRVPTEKITYIDGVNIQLIAVLEANQFRNGSALVNYSVEFDCGNGICEENEGPEVCCTDCGCPTNKECGGNVCTIPQYDTCSDVSSCDDLNACTFDSCTGVPKHCSYTNKTSCKNDDSCCPTVCTEFNDNDCSSYVSECTIDADCDDNNASTSDSCSPLTKLCKYKYNISIEEIIILVDPVCVVDEDCIQYGVTACERAFCDEEKECDIETLDGCEVDGLCVEFNAEYNGSVCNDGELELLPPPTSIIPELPVDQWIAVVVLLLELGSIMWIMRYL